LNKNNHRVKSSKGTSFYSYNFTHLISTYWHHMKFPNKNSFNSRGKNLFNLCNFINELDRLNYMWCKIFDMGLAASLPLIKNNFCNKRRMKKLFNLLKRSSRERELLLNILFLSCAICDHIIMCKFTTWRAGKNPYHVLLLIIVLPDSLTAVRCCYIRLFKLSKKSKISFQYKCHSWTFFVYYFLLFFWCGKLKFN
jgi:hypothetical protein